MSRLNVRGAIWQKVFLRNKFYFNPSSFHMQLEDEIEKLNSHKLRNREDTLNLSRLMVRAEDFNSRVMLLRLLQTGEPACRRLFLDYHGLRVLWSWMADLGTGHENVELKIEVSDFMALASRYR